MRHALPVLLLVLPAAADFPKVSPFEAVRWRDDVPEVQVRGDWYELVSIDGHRADAIVDHSKRAFRGKWRKRFEEDLVELLASMGHAPAARVTLVLKDLASGKRKTLDGVEMTKENRRRIRDAAQEREEAGPLSGEQVAKDLEFLKGALDRGYSYATRKGFDYAAALDALRADGANGLDRNDFAIRLQRIVSRFGDGHSGVDRFALPAPYLPFLVEAVGDRLVAFHGDRADFVAPGHPYLKSIDGVEITRWLAVARAIVPDASPQFVRSHSARLLRQIGWLRGELGLAAGTLRVELQAEDGATTTVEVAPADRPPTYGDWPRGASRVLDGNVGYLRIASMEDDAPFLAALVETMEKMRGTKGLVIDVRGNGGGGRDALLALFPYFPGPDEAPYVANVAAYCLQTGETRARKEGYLDNRFLYPASASVWSKEERAAIAKFAAAFEPEWVPPADLFSEWHYLVLKRGRGAGPYGKPVVVLMDEGCFSATDIFLGAFKGRKGVTLVGRPSGGGSGRVRPVRLPNSGIVLRLSTMVSFQRSGLLFDGRGVEPDVFVEGPPTDLVGKSDAALAKALDLLR